MLGGAARETPIPTLEEFHAGMQAGANVRGVMVGRNVAFARREDPRAVAAAVAAIVHRRAPMDQALGILDAERGRDMDVFRAIKPW
jgi:DhnA family fructose-bisphosphate aldolase class Ia